MQHKLKFDTIGTHSVRSIILPYIWHYFTSHVSSVVIE